MKQIAKTPEVIDKLRAAFGPDANIDNLAVHETVALNTLPLRKTGGLFRGARANLSLLSESAAAINKESVPIRVEHFSDDTPFGRAFYGEMLGDELRVLFTVDKVAHPDVVQKLDSGTLDQVSVGMRNKALTCSKCDFNYMAPGAEANVWMLECDEGHQIGVDGTHVWMDGVDQFLEMSLVGSGAVNGAKIVGPSDARLQKTPELQRLAASANGGVGVVCLSSSQKETETVDLTALTARIEALSADKTTAEAQVTKLTADNAALTAQVAELTAKAEAGSKVDEIQTQLTAAQTDLATATDLLKAELKAVSTAAGKTVEDDKMPADIASLAAAIAEHRANLTALIPPGGKSKAADTESEAAPQRPTAAFSTRQR